MKDDEDETLSLDDDEPRRIKKKRTRNREEEVDSSPGVFIVGASVILFYAKMIFFSIGFALVFIAVDQIDSIRTIEFVAFACFCLIAARLAQAEEHRLRDKNH